MRISSPLVLTFLLNAFWQVALIAGLAAFGSWLLRKSVARYRHWLWASALCLAFFVPAITASQTLFDTFAQSNSPVILANETIPPLVEGVPDTAPAPITAAFRLNQTLVLALLAVYFAFLIFRIIKLIQAWQTTRRIRHSAVELEPDDRITQIIHRCELEIGARSRKVKVFRSETLPVPVTIGLFHPAIILPDPLLREGNVELLTSAIAHEFIHVARHDYLLNFIYELLFVPISFHPAAALLRRRVKQTRELCCDELVAERILNAEVYARSLVRLASSAPPLRRLSVTTTVGIADADILEARIMSLLRKPELNTRWKKLLLVAVSLLLLVPCVAAATYAMRFDVDTKAQEPAPQEQKRKERVADPRVREEMERKREVEMEMREVQQAALVRLAKINMDQAIQIATSQQPGKVLMCTLQGSHWKEPGVLAEDGYVFYRVVIANENSEGATHVWVNAVDGSIVKTEKELPRKRQP
ncbi:MAG TPA: M56 family metallopeptidase [Pyrinomonadaceae bacterium]|nr:M56 family metallopeptidase [Pyrinomonadaceae bacterium]